MTDANLAPPKPPTATSSLVAARLRGFGPLGLVPLLLIFAGGAIFMPIAAALILLWAWLSKTPWRDLGLAWPKNWLAGLAAGLAIGIVLKLVMRAAVLPLLLGAPPAGGLYHSLVGNWPDTLDLILYALYGAGFAEELFFHGYLFERLSKLMGTGIAGSLAALILTTALFAVAHWQQGLYGIVNAAIVGAVLGLVFLYQGRKLYVAMIAHAAFDITAALLIYLDLDTSLSHLIYQ